MQTLFLQLANFALSFHVYLAFRKVSLGLSILLWLSAAFCCYVHAVRRILNMSPK
jgi:hypothetical protein